MEDKRAQALNEPEVRCKGMRVQTEIIDKNIEGTKIFCERYFKLVWLRKPDDQIDKANEKKCADNNKAFHPYVFRTQNNRDWQECPDSGGCDDKRY